MLKYRDKQPGPWRPDGPLNAVGDSAGLFLNEVVGLCQFLCRNWTCDGVHLQPWQDRGANGHWCGVRPVIL